MSITRLIGAERSRYFRCHRAEVARRRQLEMSIGLIVILVVALVVGAIVLPLSYDKAEQLTAKPTAVATSMKRDATVRTPVRVIPIYSSQALSQTPSSRRS
jgi:flagellar basal body-associated protein FliL